MSFFVEVENKAQRGQEHSSVGTGWVGTQAGCCQSVPWGGLVFLV